MEVIFRKENQSEGTLIHLSPREALTYLQNGAAILDIRPAYETNYRNFDVPTVYLLPFAVYRDKFQEIPKDKPLIIADSVGIKSPEVARLLLNQGYPHVACLGGGVVAWAQDGFPLIRDADYELVGACACMLKPKKI